MKGAALLLLAILMAAVGVMAFPGLLSGSKEGELAFSPESTDMGRVPLDQEAPFSFEMRNVGGKPVRVIKAYARAVEGC